MSGYGSEAEEFGEEEFSVKILDKKMVDGEVHYYVKWKGFGDDGNSWERGDNLDCRELIAEFEGKLKIEETAEVRKPETKSEPMKAIGFERGLKPEQILGATDKTGEITYVMKWVGTNEWDMVRSGDAHQRCPQLVIEFYEKHLKSCEGGNSWEPVGDLDSPDSIAEFEEKLENGTEKMEVGKPEYESEPMAASGFERGLKPERVISLDDWSGEWMFHIKFVGTDECDWVRRVDARRRCPQLVIEFYENILCWND